MNMYAPGTLILDNLAPLGVHENVDERVYHRWDGASNSRLSTIHEKSEGHLKAELDNPIDPTDDMIFGTALHIATLEPDHLSERVVVEPVVNRRTNAGKEELEVFRARNAGKVILSPTQWDNLIGARDAVFAHPWARQLIDEAAPDDRELSIAWDDPETGVRVKARLDAVNRRGRAIVDVKKTKDASRRGFGKACANFGYHRQAALYTEGADILDVMKGADFVHVAVEGVYPFKVGVYCLDDEALGLGEAQVRALLRRYATALETGDWPTSSGRIEPLALPKWAFYD